MQGQWMLYGANGYTGELIAAEAARTGLRPVLAGRREEAIRPIAERLGLEWRAFPLERAEAELSGFAAILLVAGPFSATSGPVVAACLKTRTHYLDITGEIPVFEACQRLGEPARAAGIVLLPGSGFDVVPSDCLAASLAAALPGATHLELAFAGDGGFSKGTAKTMVEGLSQGGCIRQDGELRRVPLGWKSRDIPFRDRTRRAVTIPWGDVATAFHSTGIPNIVVYMAMPPSQIRALRVGRLLLPLLALGPVQRLAKRRIEKTVRGPDETTRRTARMHLWGLVRDAAGRELEGTLETPEGYALTVQSSLECLRRILAGKAKPGAHTPSTAFGAGFIGELAGCDLRLGTAAAGSAAAG